MAVDCGVAINPITASVQVEGGMVQALGYAHCEEMIYDEFGRMVNAELGPYKIYRADEMPELDVTLVQTLEPTGPFGAKAIAEIPKGGVAPAHVPCMGLTNLERSLSRIDPASLCSSGTSSRSGVSPRQPQKPGHSHRPARLELRPAWGIM